jgi:hypothetical protein
MNTKTIGSTEVCCSYSYIRALGLLTLLLQTSISMSPAGAQPIHVTCVEVPQAQFAQSRDRSAGWSECQLSTAITNAKTVARGRASGAISEICKSGISPLRGRTVCQSHQLHASTTEESSVGANPPIAAPGGGAISSFTFISSGSNLVKLCTVQRDLPDEVDAYQPDGICFGIPRAVVFAKARASCGIQCKP